MQHVQSSPLVSPELALIRSPRPVYAAMAAKMAPRVGIRWLRRPLLAALSIGVSVALAATGHLTLALVASTTICWMVVVLAQLAIAAAFIAPRARDGIGTARALELFFAAHVPWSLTLLVFAALMAMTSPVGRGPALLLMFLFPMIATPRMIAAFFEQVLRLDPARARRLTAAHQTITWGSLLVAYGYAVQLWPRVTGLFR